MEIRAHKGFTLVELVVTVAVAGVLLAVGVPSFIEAVRESRMSTQYNQVVGSLYLARSEAVKRRRFVTVCPRSTADASACGDRSNWNNGWIVFVDNTVDTSSATAAIDLGDEVLSIEPPIKGDNAITVVGSPAGNATEINDRAYVRYQAPGNSSWSSASVIICDAERGAASSRAVNVLLTGDIRRARKNSSDGIERDAFNRSLSITCPDGA